MITLEGYEGPYAGRTDCEGLLKALPPLGGIAHAHAALRRVAEQWDTSGMAGGFMLSGRSGAGKSTAALHALRRALAERDWARRSMWVLASDLVESEDIAHRARKAFVLVLDDVGKDVGSDTRHGARLFRLLDYRYLRYPTIITTGLTKQMLRASFDDATIRRMTEFRGKRIRALSLYEEDRPPRAGLPPSDQEELARRMGERL